MKNHAMYDFYYFIKKEKKVARSFGYDGTFYNHFSKKNWFSSNRTASREPKKTNSYNLLTNIFGVLSQY